LDCPLWIDDYEQSIPSSLKHDETFTTGIRLAARFCPTSWRGATTHATTSMVSDDGNLDKIAWMWNNVEVKNHEKYVRGSFFLIKNLYICLHAFSVP